MEHQKIANLLGNTSDKVPRFIPKKWIEVHDQSGGAYNTKHKIQNINAKIWFMWLQWCIYRC